MVGHERPRQRAAVERLEDRGLDLEEAAVVEPAADRADDLGAEDEQLPRLRIREQVELAMPVARLDVLESVVLLGDVAQRLREQLPVRDQQAQLAAAGLERGPVDADQVADVERDEPVEGFLAEHIALRVELELALAVDQVDEGGAALVAAGDHSAGHPVCAIGLLPGFQIVDDSEVAATPGNSCGKGSMPCSRRRSSLARRSSTGGKLLSARSW